MFGALAKRLFGTVNDRIVKSFSKDVDAINALEETIAALSDEELKGQTEKFRTLLEEGKTLDDIMHEAFATVREASKRTIGLRHFDVQLLGGMVLHRGMISEMRTGEGKTLVSTLAVYLNAIEGKGVHVVTVNDYLAKRDAEWMGPIYDFLGLSVGCILNHMDDEARYEAYQADITYGTNNEFGFDYLRDNMKFSLSQMVQRPFHYAIIDEVDSILIDEARTPLIISGPTEDNLELYVKVNNIIPGLPESCYEKDEKSRSVTLTDEGTNHVEGVLKERGLLEEGGSLYDIQSISLLHHVNQALRAHVLFTKDVDYMIKDGKVCIIDEFTGRVMEGRRYSEGLHQALEAKEGAKIQNENQTLASITFQNYFRLYPKLGGMTGTAMTEASEFKDIYSLDVVDIPTNVPVQREDEDDEIYLTADEKYEAIFNVIEERHKVGQPILVGTISIEKSEHLSKFLKKKKIPHNVLNAKYHEQEATIIAQAGAPGAITIATNMAGRGTDIKLGGNPEMMLEERLKKGQVKDKEAELAKIEKKVEDDKQKVLEQGGLLVLATERHESRRIDNQLRGRSGRQGDPGRTKFYLSLEDDLMRIFASERMAGLLQKLGLEKGEAIHHPLISKALEGAQHKVEARNYDIRKNLLKFDDVMNDQRRVIYEQRIDMMQEDDVSETIEGMAQSVVEELVGAAIPVKSYPEEWDISGLSANTLRIFNLDLPIDQWAEEEGIAETEIEERLNQAVKQYFTEKEERYGPEVMRMLEKRILLMTLDQLWKDHLLSLDHLRQGINLRAYAQRDPLNEYKREAFLTFESMLAHLREVVIQHLSHIELVQEIEGDVPPPPSFEGMKQMRHDPAEDRDPADPSTWGKVGRNEVCPCGSGKKYKHCHGQI